MPPSSLHVGQRMCAKRRAASFCPAVILTDENKDWIRHKSRLLNRERERQPYLWSFLSLFIVKGKSSYISVFSFGDMAERSWIQTKRTQVGSISLWSDIPHTYLVGLLSFIDVGQRGHDTLCNAGIVRSVFFSMTSSRWAWIHALHSDDHTSTSSKPW